MVQSCCLIKWSNGNYFILSKSKMLHDKMSHDKMPNDKMSNDKMSNNKMSNNKMSNDKMSKSNCRLENVESLINVSSTNLT
jgi:CRISPR/Cas system-associated endonuclease/helicase Cas3